LFVIWITSVGVPLGSVNGPVRNSNRCSVLRMGYCVPPHELVTSLPSAGNHSSGGTR
jgi:hypothetical protein